jgi:hypothetical protein
VTLDLSGPFEAGASASIARSVDRAEAGLSFDGVPLRPLATGATAGPAMSGRLETLQRVNIQADGFTVTYDDDALEFFHRGSPRQPPRPIVGLPSDLVPEINRHVAREVASQLSRSLRS